MQSQNGSESKTVQFQLRQVQNNEQIARQSSSQYQQPTFTQKCASQNATKSSNQLLNQIYSILDSRQSLKRKDSAKSLDKKESATSFKCKCKKTKCLKMYCQCFAIGKFCVGCNCQDCQNLLDYQEQRALAIDQAFSRDPDIFQNNSTSKKGGCICKKTQCLKKYCQCFSSGIPCTAQCKCQNCCNTA